MNNLKNIVFFLFLGGLTELLLYNLKSNYFEEFLSENLITLLFAILAINITTFSVVLTKLNDLKKKHKCSFDNTIREFEKSVIEQILLIFIAIMVFSAIESKFIADYTNLKEYLAALAISCFYYSIYILYDTSKAIFVLLEYEDSSNE